MQVAAVQFMGKAVEQSIGPKSEQLGTGNGEELDKATTSVMAAAAWADMTSKLMAGVMVTHYRPPQPRGNFGGGNRGGGGGGGRQYNGGGGGNSGGGGNDFGGGSGGSGGGDDTLSDSDFSFL